MRWDTARDARTVHALVEESDRAAALRTGTAAPVRRPEATRRLVDLGVVRLGRVDGVAVVTVTVGPVPSFDPDGSALPRAELPWYMQRLAVRPGCPDPLAGVRAVRHAVELASAAGADALRAEANPDLPDVLTLLTALGFTRHNTLDGTPRRTRLHHCLARRPSTTGGS